MGIYKSISAQKNFNWSKILYMMPFINKNNINIKHAVKNKQRNWVKSNSIQ